MNEPQEDSHWVRWHRAYESEGSPLRLRRAAVQRNAIAALDAIPPGQPIRILSLCAGDGRDIIDALAHHPRRADVSARLVELDPDLASAARTAAAGLTGIEVKTGDASTTDAAVGIPPTNLILLCGIFGNISAPDIRNCIELLPMLSAAAATVIWTRHRRAPDLTPTIRSWFDAAGFDELAFETPDPAGLMGVGSHRLRVPSRPFESGRRLFTFTGNGRGG